MTKKEIREKPGILLTQNEGKKERIDPPLFVVLKRFRENLLNG